MEAAEKYFVHAKEILYMEAEKYVVPPKGNTRHLHTTKVISTVNFL